MYPSFEIASNPFNLVVHFAHNHFPYKYITFDSEKMNLELNKWNKISFDYLTPEVRSASDYLKVYFWHRGKEPIFIDDLQINVFEKKK